MGLEGSFPLTLRSAVGGLGQTLEPEEVQSTGAQGVQEGLDCP